MTFKCYYTCYPFGGPPNIIRYWSLITGRCVGGWGGGGLHNGRGVHMKFYPHKKWVVGGKSFSHIEGGGGGGHNMFPHFIRGVRKDLPCL